MSIHASLTCSWWCGVQVLPVFVERLRSESTRLAAIKALIVMSASPHALDMSPILHDVMSELHSLLRYVDSRFSGQCIVPSEHGCQG